MLRLPPYAGLVYRAGSGTLVTSKYLTSEQVYNSLWIEYDAKPIESVYQDFPIEIVSDISVDQSLVANTPLYKSSFKRRTAVEPYRNWTYKRISVTFIAFHGEYIYVADVQTTVGLTSTLHYWEPICKVLR